MSLRVFNLRLAVTAPWCIELNEDVLGLVQDNVGVVLSDNSGHRTLLFRNRLTLDAGLNVAGNKVVKELGNVLLRNVLAGEGELLVLLSVLDGESRPFADLEVQVGSVLAEGLGINGGKANLTLVLLGDRPEIVGKRLALLGSVGEDVSEGNTSLREDVLATISR